MFLNFKVLFDWSNDWSNDWTDSGDITFGRLKSRYSECNFLVGERSDLITQRSEFDTQRCCVCVLVGLGPDLTRSTPLNVR